MQQVLMNLIQNAAEAVGTNGKISLRAQSLPGGTVEIIAADNGPGIKEEIRSKIFNLYFTTKASGTGIGLSVVQRIVYEHGGMINAESEPGSGTRFILHMPLTVS
jgi:signal transduction histidine kinase